MMFTKLLLFIFCMHSQ